MVAVAVAAVVVVLAVVVLAAVVAVAAAVVVLVAAAATTARSLAEGRRGSFLRGFGGRRARWIASDRGFREGLGRRRGG